MRSGFTDSDRGFGDAAAAAAGFNDGGGGGGEGSRRCDRDECCRP
jgi:hypothetical protein